MLKTQGLAHPSCLSQATLRRRPATAFFRNEARACDEEGKTALKGKCGPQESDLPMAPLNSAKERANLCRAEKVPRDPEGALPACEARAAPALIRFLRACAGFPCKERWIACMKRNCCQGWPGLAAQRARKCLGQLEHFTFGRQRTLNKNIRTAQEPEDGTSEPEIKKEEKTIKEEDLSIKPMLDAEPSKVWGTLAPLGLGHPRIKKFQERKHGTGVFATKNAPSMLEGEDLAPDQKEKLKRVASTDQAGRFPVASARGHTALLAMCDFDSNCIDAEPIKGQSENELIRAWERCCEDLRRAGFRAVLQRIGSETSKKMITHIEKSGLKIEVAAPGNHRTNPVERAIQSLKGHMISIISSLGPGFPMDQWDLLMPQIIITLNLQHESRHQQLLSACAQIKGSFDFNKAPLAPLGCAAIAHKRPAGRGTRAGCGIAGFCVGPAFGKC